MPASPDLRAELETIIDLSEAGASVVARLGPRKPPGLSRWMS